MTIDQSQALYSGRMLETLNYMRCKEANKIVPSVTMSGVSPNVGLQFYKMLVVSESMPLSGLHPGRADRGIFSWLRQHQCDHLETGGS